MSNYYTKYIPAIDNAIISSKQNITISNDRKIKGLANILFLLIGFNNNRMLNDLISYEEDIISELELLKDRILNNDINFERFERKLLEELLEDFK